MSQAVPPSSAPPATLDQQMERKIQEVVYHQLLETGEKERLQELFKERLIESGWYEELKSRCRELIAEIGPEACSTEQLLQPLSEFGRQQVPDALRQEFLTQSRMALAPYTHVGQ